MANLLYPSAKSAFLRGEIDLLSDTIVAALIDTTDYAFNSTHTALSEIPLAARIAQETLTAKSVSAGLFDAGDVTFGSVTGDVVTALLLWKEGASDALSPLIAYLDTDIVGLPATPGGGDIEVIWSASGVFAL